MSNQHEYHKLPHELPRVSRFKVTRCWFMSNNLKTPEDWNPGTVIKSHNTRVGHVPVVIREQSRNKGFFSGSWYIWYHISTSGCPKNMFITGNEVGKPWRYTGSSMLLQLVFYILIGNMDARTADHCNRLDKRSSRTTDIPTKDRWILDHILDWVIIYDNRNRASTSWKNSVSKSFISF